MATRISVRRSHWGRRLPDGAALYEGMHRRRLGSMLCLLVIYGACTRLEYDGRPIRRPPPTAVRPPLPAPAQPLPPPANALPSAVPAKASAPLVAPGAEPPHATAEPRPRNPEEQALIAEATAEVAQLEAAVAARDFDAMLYQQLAGALYLLGDTQAVALPNKFSKATFQRGAIVAERGMRAAAIGFERARQAGIPVEQAVGQLPSTALPLVYWYSLHVTRWANLQGMLVMMREMPAVRSLMHLVATKAASYDHGGAHRWFGVYFAKAPAIAGGSIDESRRAFAKAFAEAPEYLDNHVMHAAFYAASIKHETLWRRGMNRAAGATLTGNSRYIRAQRLAKRKAELALRRPMRVP